MPLPDDMPGDLSGGPVQIGGLPPSVYDLITRGSSPAASGLVDVPGTHAQVGPDWGGLPVSIPQYLGWAHPDRSVDTSGGIPALVPTGPTPPTTPVGQLPPGQVSYARGGPVAPGDAMREPPPPAPAPPASIPAQPVPQPSPRPSPPGPQRAPTFGQRVDALEQRQAGTEAEQRAAIDAQVAAEQGLHKAEGAAYQNYEATTKANAAARQAEADTYAKYYETNAAKVAADRQQIESWKYNRNQYMDELGVGGKVRWGIAMVLAGIGQGLMHQGGANPVVEMLQQQIHDANDAQLKQRDAIVQKLGFDREGQQDAATYHAQRQAELDKKDGMAGVMLAKQLEEAAVNTADPIARARGMKAAADVRAMSDQQLKGYVEMRSQHDLQAQSNAIAGGHLGETIRHNKFEEGFQVYKENQEAELKAAALAAKQQGKLSDEESKRALYIPGPDGQRIVARKSDGSPVLSGTPELASKDNDMVSAAASYNRLIGQMVRGMNDHGGESGYFKSSDWQKMQTDLESAVAELHDAYGITSFREPTMKFFEKMTTGGVDPTSFIFDATSALKRSNENLQAKVNSRVQGRGYDGPAFKFQDTSAPPAPQQTEEDETLKRGLVNPYRMSPNILATEVGKLSSRGELGRNETISTRLRDAGDVLPSVRQAMLTAAAGVASSDPRVRQISIERLDKLASESESPGTAALAKELLDRAINEQIAKTPGSPEFVRGPGGVPAPSVR